MLQKSYVRKRIKQNSGTYFNDLLHTTLPIGIFLQHLESVKVSSSGRRSTLFYSSRSWTECFCPATGPPTRRRGQRENSRLRALSSSAVGSSRCLTPHSLKPQSTGYKSDTPLSTHHSAHHLTATNWHAVLPSAASISLYTKTQDKFTWSRMFTPLRF